MQTFMHTPNLSWLFCLETEQMLSLSFVDVGFASGSGAPVSQYDSFPHRLAEVCERPREAAQLNSTPAEMNLFSVWTQPISSGSPVLRHFVCFPCSMWTPEHREPTRFHLCSDESFGVCTSRSCWVALQKQGSCLEQPAGMHANPSRAFILPLLAP